MSPVRMVCLLLSLFALSLPATFFLDPGLLAGKHKQGSADAAAEELCEKGLEAMLEQKYSKAIAAFSKAIERDPKCVEAYLGRGDAFRASGELDRAQYDYDCAARLDPDNDEARERATELRKQRAGVGD